MTDTISPASSWKSPPGRIAPETAKGGSEATFRLPLAKRETEVMTLMVEGLTNREIGAHLGISHRTVEIYRMSAMQKLGAPNAIRAAIMFDRMTSAQLGELDERGEAVRFMENALRNVADLGDMTIGDIERALHMVRLADRARMRAQPEKGDHHD